MVSVLARSAPITSSDLSAGTGTCCFLSTPSTLNLKFKVLSGLKVTCRSEAFSATALDKDESTQSRTGDLPDTLSGRGREEVALWLI